MSALFFKIYLFKKRIWKNYERDIIKLLCLGAQLPVKSAVLLKLCLKTRASEYLNYGVCTTRNAEVMEHIRTRAFWLLLSEHAKPENEGSNRHKEHS